MIGFEEVSPRTAYAWISPDLELLEKALAVSPMIKYFPTPEEIKVLVETGEEPEVIYNRIVLALSKELYDKYPGKTSIKIRGGGTSIGQAIEFSTPNEDFGLKIKGIEKLVETGTETWESPQHVKVAHAPRSGDEIMHGYVGLYAHSWTRRIRSAVPPEFRRLIFPIITVRAGEYGEPTDFYILDFLQESIPKTI